jgi:hypothetical protein
MTKGTTIILEAFLYPLPLNEDDEKALTPDWVWCSTIIFEV